MMRNNVFITSYSKNLWRNLKFLIKVIKMREEMKREAGGDREEKKQMKKTYLLLLLQCKWNGARRINEGRRYCTLNFFFPFSLLSIFFFFLLFFLSMLTLTIKKDKTHRRSWNLEFEVWWSTWSRGQKVTSSS